MNLSNMSDVEEREHFEKITRTNMLRKKKSQCMYPNCNDVSIGSHAISKNYHIKQISERNHVMSFKSRRNEKSKELYLKKVGINDASVFPGFCKKHDEIFESIDKKGICTLKELLLQCYRSVCYWLHILTVDGEMIREIQNDVNDTMKAHCLKTIPHFDYDKFRSDDTYLNSQIDTVSFVDETKLILEKVLEKENKQTKLDRTQIITIADLEIYYCKIPENIPVILNTINSTVTGNIFHIVLPNKENTDIIVINASNKKISLYEAWKSRTSNMLNVIGLIESWMMACEEWYIRPSIITNISEERREIICQDIRYWNGESKLWQPYDISIFDELRLKYLSYYKNNECLSDEREKEEKKKFGIPNRMSKEEREKNMINKMHSDILF